MYVAKTYLTIVALGGVFVLVSSCYSNIIRAEGQAGKAMMGQLVGNLLNVILDPIRILLFDWGIAGAWERFKKVFLFGVFNVLANALQAMGAATAALIVNLSRQGIIYSPALLLFILSCQKP